jgi:hypothetical protein
VLGLLVLVAYLVIFALGRPLPVEGEPPADGYVRVPGVLHVHTTFSDGGGTPEEVIAAAKTAGVRFLIITDHNNADAKSFEGYRDGVLVIVGSELSTTAGHILGVGIAEPTYRFSGDALDGVSDIRDLGGMAIAAHPFNLRPDFRFTGFDLPGNWGLELINGDSEWRSAGPRVVSSVVLYGVNPLKALLGLLNPPDEALARWDGLLVDRDVVGLAGADAHSRMPLTKSRSVRFPSYESLFQLQRNYVLLKQPLSGRFEEDRALVLAALREGRVYLGLDALAPAGEFSFVAQTPDRTVTMGETIAPPQSLKLQVSGRMPRGSNVQLLRDGKVIASGASNLDFAVSAPGVYRCQIFVPGSSVPWVLSNPIYVFDNEAAKRRADRAVWPKATEPAPPVQVLEDFEKDPVFKPGADPTSTLAQTLEPRADTKGRKAALLDFQLGEGTDANRNVFVATVDWTHRDLRGKSALVFSIRGDGVYRVSVQVRDENKASRDEGTEWWFGSVRTSKEWTRVAIPFSRLRSINPMTDGRLDLDKVRALVFVIDRGAMKPGSKGRIWLDDIGVS